MKKEFSVTGKTGTRTGTINIQPHNERVVVPNRWTHDEETVTIVVWSVTVYIDGKEIKREKYKHDIPMSKIEEIERVLENRLKSLADTEPLPSLSEILSLRGYK